MYTAWSTTRSFSSRLALGGPTIIGGGVKSSSIEGNPECIDVKLISTMNQVRFKAFWFQNFVAVVHSVEARPTS